MRAKRCCLPISIDDIKRIISLQLGVKVIGDNDRLLVELGAESLDVMNIVVAIEEKFNIQIEEMEILDIQTPAAIYQLVIDRTPGF